MAGLRVNRTTVRHIDFFPVFGRGPKKESLVLPDLKLSNIVLGEFIEETAMNKTLGFTSIFCISAGAMISSGLFVLPGLAFAQAGPSVFISYFLAGCAALTTVLSLSELITAMPMAGGDHYYVSRSFGQLFGTVSGMLSWMALSLKSAFAVIGIAELVYIVWGGNLVLYAVILAVMFTVLNLCGVKEAVRFQIALVLVLIAILGAFFFISVGGVRAGRFEPFLPHGLNSLFSTAGFVFVSFGGVLTTASIAGEVRNPSRNIPRGLIGSTVVVTLLYSTVIFVVVGVVPTQQLAQSLAPIAIAGKISGGSLVYYAIIAASLLAFITTANGGILTASRYPIALSSDGMLPSFFSWLSGTKNTPIVSIIATGTLITAAVLLNIELLIKAASTVILLSNIFAHLSVIVMRESTISNYRPTYRSPLYPWLQIAGILIFSLLIIDMGIQPVLLSLAFTSIGVILYFLRRGSLEKMSPALIHVLERITNKKLVTEGLKNELRNIVEDRDNIVRDEFDNAVEMSRFLDIAGKPSIEDLWAAAASELHDTLPASLDKENIIRLLQEREKESATAISHFVAIPHVIVEGTTVFKLVFVRAVEGVHFGTSHPSIRAIFILIGSKDMRNLHLRALAAIAQVVQHSGFERGWLSAKSHRELKDLFLLTARQRPQGGI
jgi:amino acid transporter/mannitol/fructose-specific phosphotransferase system IIA component (Ntr-type)